MSRNYRRLPTSYRRSLVDACLIESCFAMSTIKLMIFVDAEKIGNWGVVKDGKSCRCGHHGGCLESATINKAIVKQAWVNSDGLVKSHFSQLSSQSTQRITIFINYLSL